MASSRQAITFQPVAMFVSDQRPDFLPFRYLLYTTGLRLPATCRTTGTDNAAQLGPAPDVPPLSDGVPLSATLKTIAAAEARFRKCATRDGPACLQKSCRGRFRAPRFPSDQIRTVCWERFAALVVGPACRDPNSTHPITASAAPRAGAVSFPSSDEMFLGTGCSQFLGGRKFQLPLGLLFL